MNARIEKCRVRTWLRGALLAALAACTGPAARAADYRVPDVFPSVQAAVAAAVAGAAATSTITITASPIITGGTITIGADFDAAHTLTIRPLKALGRATIASNNGGVPLFSLETCGHVTLQDLDILRNATNAENLVSVSMSENVIVERCRIGSIWTTPGAADKSLLRISYPKDNIVRNCIFFSYFPGTFDRGIYATNFLDDLRSLFLYNNDVADYKLYGIEVDDGGGADPEALVVLRNNVCVNHPDAPAGLEPHAWRTLCNEIIVVKSNNAAFATDVAHVEVAGILGAQSLSGIDNPLAWSFERFDRPQVDDAFISRSWVIAPPWEPNPLFFDLDEDVANPLHDGPEDYGMDVLDGVPYLRDKAVTDDIDRQLRPSDDPSHTDRGADQLYPGVSLAVGPAAPTDRLLWAAPRANPSASVGIRYRTDRPGRLGIELFDLSGRRLHRSTRVVSPGEDGLFEWSGAATGVLHYRLSLDADGAHRDAVGRIVVVR